MKSFVVFFSFFLFFSPLLRAEMGYVEPWGTDAGLVHSFTSPKEASRALSPAAKMAEQVILFHHHVLTHICGPRSHFRPTSSQYMLEAIRKHGFIQGYIMGCDRLLRENGDPWVYRTKQIKSHLYKWDPPP